MPGNYDDIIKMAQEADARAAAKPKALNPPATQRVINSPNPWVLLKNRPAGLPAQDSDAVEGFVKSFKSVK